MLRHLRMRFDVWTKGALVGAALFSAACSAPRPRNVLIVTLDTMRADRLPPYGFTELATPAIERIAAEGALFEEAFASVPLTLPSHATLFTGLYPPRLGVRDNAGAPLASDFVTLAERLADRGMATGAFVSSAVLAPGRGIEQGFGTYSLGDRASCAGSRQVRRRADQVVDEALAWIEERDPHPFFAWVHFYDTHRPYRLPDEYSRGFADPYAAAIAFEDAQLGRLIDRLAALQQLDDTLIVIVGDHGESLGEHGEDSHGIFVYQEALHVPLMMRGPGILPRRVGATVRVADVMPTILDLLGLESSPMDGASLTPLLKGAGERHAREVYAESLYPQRFGWASLRSLRAGQYKVIDAPRPEVFDLSVDPDEQHNLAASRPTLTDAMLRQLHSFRAEAETADTPAPVDSAVAGRIASLGYVAGAPVEVGHPADDRPDPKDTIEAFNQMTRIQWARGPVRGRAAETCSAAVDGS